MFIYIYVGIYMYNVYLYIDDSRFVLAVGRG